MNADPGLGTVGSWIIGATRPGTRGSRAGGGARGRDVRDAGHPHSPRACVRRPREGRLARGRTDEQIDGIAPLWARSEQFRDSARVLAKTAVTGGRVRPIFPGDALGDSMLGEVALARELIAWLVCWSEPGAWRPRGDRVADSLVERVRAGVRVLMLVDHCGSKGTPVSHARTLCVGGVEDASLRPPRWTARYRASSSRSGRRPRATCRSATRRTAGHLTLRFRSARGAEPSVIKRVAPACTEAATSDHGRTGDAAGPGRDLLTGGRVQLYYCIVEERQGERLRQATLE